MINRIGSEVVDGGFEALEYVAIDPRAFPRHFQLHRFSQLARGIPGARLVSTGGGHGFFLEDRDEVEAELRRFLLED